MRRECCVAFCFGIFSLLFFLPYSAFFETIKHFVMCFVLFGMLDVYVHFTFIPLVPSRLVIQFVVFHEEPTLNSLIIATENVINIRMCRVGGSCQYSHCCVLRFDGSSESNEVVDQRFDSQRWATCCHYAIKHACANWIESHKTTRP